MFRKTNQKRRFDVHIQSETECEEEEEEEESVPIFMWTPASAFTCVFVADMTHLIFLCADLCFNLAKRAVHVMTFRKGEDK